MAVCSFLCRVFSIGWNWAAWGGCVFRVVICLFSA